MARSRKRNRVSVEEARVLLGAEGASLEQLVRAIRGVNPTRLDLDEGVRRERYETKHALQSLAIARFGDALEAHPTRRGGAVVPGTIGLRLRDGRGDLGHARVARLSPAARDWIERALSEPGR